MGGGGGRRREKDRAVGWGRDEGEAGTHPQSKFKRANFLDSLPLTDLHATDPSTAQHPYDGL